MVMIFLSFKNQKIRLFFLVIFFVFVFHHCTFYIFSFVIVYVCVCVMNKWKIGLKNLCFFSFSIIFYAWKYNDKIRTKKIHAKTTIQQNWFGWNKKKQLTIFHSIHSQKIIIIHALYNSLKQMFEDKLDHQDFFLFVYLSYEWMNKRSEASQIKIFIKINELLLLLLFMCVCLFVNFGCLHHHHFFWPFHWNTNQ